jgi:U4/U6 small nuclear ribonucleoprotein PRP31
MLADLDDLSDDELQENIKEEEEHVVKEEAYSKDEQHGRSGSSGAGVKVEHASCLTSALYQTVMGRLRADEEAPATTDFLNQCNELVVHLDNEIVEVYNRVRDRYRPRFPELETLVQTPLEYVSVVQAIGNEEDLTKVTELDSLLPASTVMVLTVTATTTAGTGPLSVDALNQVMYLCDLAHRLDADKTIVLQYLQRSMDRVAPNLTALVGSEVAAKLMGAAGGLKQLSTIPACNVQVIGAKRKHLAGFSTKASNTGSVYGFVYDSALVQETPPSVRAKAAKLIGSKCSLLARVDAHGNHNNGSIGVSTREEAKGKIAKWLEPPPARKPEVLAVPDAGENKKNKRGGRRARKIKEKYGLTDIKKAQNRMLFNQAEDEYFDGLGEETVGLGALGKSGVRMVSAQQKQALSDKAKKKYGLVGKGERDKGHRVTGLETSLAFTPVVGIELANPAGMSEKRDKGDGTKSVYFGDGLGFGKVAHK